MDTIDIELGLSHDMDFYNQNDKLDIYITSSQLDLQLSEKPVLRRRITNANMDDEICGTSYRGICIDNNRLYYDRKGWFSLVDWYNCFKYYTYKITGIKL